MNDKHEMTQEECSLFNSDKAYAEGFNYVHCKCGWRSPPTKSRDAAIIWSAHVAQHTNTR